MAEPASDAPAASRRPLRIAALGDAHASTAAKGRWRDTFMEVSQAADALCLCGDLTNLGTTPEAEVLAEDLRACTVPVLAVLGNHDFHCGNADDIAHVLREAGVKLLEEEIRTVDGVGFAGVKGFGGGFDEKLLGAFGEPAIQAFVQEALDQAMRLEHALHMLETERMVVLLHCAPIAQTLEGEAEVLFPFLGSSRLAETIDRFEGVRAVFHGHAHHGIYEGRTRKGVAVYNAAASVPKPSGKPYALVEL